MTTMTVIGGGFAGLVAAISSTELGVGVVLHEAHRELGGRARATPPYVAHQGQVQLPLRPGEPVASGRRRIERLVDPALPAGRSGRHGGGTR